MPVRRKGFPLQISQWTGQADKRERDWLNKAWKEVKVSYGIDDSTKLGAARLGLRAISLAGIYQDFCRLAWSFDQEFCFQCEAWAKKFGITNGNIFFLADIEGADFPYQYREDDPDLVMYSVMNLANSLRSEVFDILCPNYFESPGLFEELCATKDPDEVHETLSRVSDWLYEKCSPLSR